jgi:transcription elongation factor Elf1
MRSRVHNCAHCRRKSVLKHVEIPVKHCKRCELNSQLNSINKLRHIVEQQKLTDEWSIRRRIAVVRRNRQMALTIEIGLE